MGRVFKLRPDIHQKDGDGDIKKDVNGKEIYVWDGYIEVEVPDLAGQTALKAESAKWQGKGEKDFDVESSAKRMRELALDVTKGVNLTHIETGEAFTDVEELTYLAEWNDIILYLYAVCINGPKLRNILRGK